jgi:hypothetical protein
MEKLGDQCKVVFAQNLLFLGGGDKWTYVWIFVNLYNMVCILVPSIVVIYVNN